MHYKIEINCFKYNVNLDLGYYTFYIILRVVYVHKKILFPVVPTIIKVYKISVNFGVEVRGF